MKKKIVGFLLMLVLVLTMGALAACGGKEPPEPQTGEIYRTSVVKANINASAYVSFKDYGEEANEWGEKGKVYEIHVSAYGKDYSMWADGFWTLEGDTLTVTPKNHNESNCCFTDTTVGEAKTYTATDKVFSIGGKVAGSTVTFKLDISGSDIKEPCTDHVDGNNDGKCDVCGEDMPINDNPDITIESAASTYGQKAKMEFFNTDGTWKLYLIYAEGMQYSYAAGGTFAVGADYNMTLTVTDDQGEMIKTNPLTVAVDASGYPDIKYTCELTVAIPQIGNLNFSLAIPDPEIHYTVTFDWNYSGSTPVQVVTKTYTDKTTGAKSEYAERDEDWVPPEQQVLRVPEREGYKFAGWDYKQNPELENGASKTEYYPGLRQPSYNVNDSTPNSVYPITKDTTIYARWVQATHITDEAGLRAIANDLNGWYILDNDITLTQDWTPVGKYYSHYEFINASWWKYAFCGTFDGNNHTINGLKITSLAFTGGDQDATDSLGNPIGTYNGTAAMFGAIANGTVKNLTLNAPVVKIQNYANQHHAYVSALVGFTMGSQCTFVNNTITNADIDVSVSNVYYVAVAGTIAGHWGGGTEGGTLSGTIDVNVAYTNDYNVGETYIYAGQIAGENWSFVKNTQTNVALNVTVSDARETAQLPQNSVIKLYAGGVGGSSAFSENVTAGGSVTVDASAVVANKLSGRFGAIGGAQGHGIMKDCTLTTEFTVTTNKAATNELMCGTVIGSYNDFGMWMSTLDRLQYDGGHIKVNNCTSTGVSFTIDGEAKTPGAIGKMPTAQDFANNYYLAYICPKLAEFTTDGVVDWEGFIAAVFGVLESAAN